MSVKIDDGKISRILDIFTEQITAEASHDDRGMVISGKSTYAYWHLTEKICLCLLSVQPIMSILFRRQTAPVQNFGTRTASISYRLAEDDVIEIRCELKICGAVFSENRVNTVKNVNVFEDKPIPPENCALTLYFADKGEKLWDIAKSHNTKLDLLLSENSAENQVLDAPKMLLIPRI